MKKFLVLPIALAVGFGILILIGSGSPGDDKDKDNKWQDTEADVFDDKGGEYVPTASGLKYRDVKVGDGMEAKAGATVVVHYTGWLTNGKKFESSRDKKKPYSFMLGQHKVIPAWDEGVAGMKVGGKRRLLVPPHLGYGERGSGPDIPPNADLVFAVELLDVK